VAAQDDLVEVFPGDDVDDVLNMGVARHRDAAQIAALAEARERRRCPVGRR
jgi:hypothetical protein